MTEPPKTYHIISVNGTQYHVAPECAAMIEAVCQDERYQRMFAIPFDWLRLQLSKRGETVKVEVAGG